MNAGKLNKRVTIQVRTTRVDEYGFEVEIWEDLKTVWASIKNLYGNEFFQAQQAKSKATKKIAIRYIKELDPSLDDRATLDYRVVYKNINYDITYIDNIREECKYLEIMLEKK